MGHLPMLQHVDMEQDPVLGWGVPALIQTSMHTPHTHFALSLWDPASRALLSPLLLLPNTGQTGSDQGWFLFPRGCCHFWARPCTPSQGKMFSVRPNCNLWPFPLVPSPFDMSFQWTAPGNRAGWR